MAGQSRRTPDLTQDDVASNGLGQRPYVNTKRLDVYIGIRTADNIADIGPVLGDLVFSSENKNPASAGLSSVGGTGLEPVTPSLSSWNSGSSPARWHTVARSVNVCARSVRGLANGLANGNESP